MENFLTGNYMCAAWIIWGIVSFLVGYYGRGKDNATNVENAE